MGSAFGLEGEGWNLVSEFALVRIDRSDQSTQLRRRRHHELDRPGCDAPDLSLGGQADRVRRSHHDTPIAVLKRDHVELAGHHAGNQSRGVSVGAVEICDLEPIVGRDELRKMLRGESGSHGDRVPNRDQVGI